MHLQFLGTNIGIALPKSKKNRCWR